MISQARQRERLEAGSLASCVRSDNFKRTLQSHLLRQRDF